jgi:hypothetical protein
MPALQVRRRRKEIESMTVSQWLLITLIIAAGMAAAFVAVAYSFNGK